MLNEGWSCQPIERARLDANKLAPYLDYLRERVAAFPELTATRLTRELRERGYSGAYTAVKRFVAAIRPSDGPKPFEVRFETAPGHQAQVDFARFIVSFEDEPGITRIVWLFALVLGHSRHIALGLVCIRIPVAALAARGTAVRLVVQSMVKRKFSVPIVFSYCGDPVAEGLVASFNMPGGNVTGVTSISREIEDKRLQLLRDLPGTDVIAILVNPNSPMAAAQRMDAERATLALGQKLTVLTASNGQEIDAAFANISERRIGALAISTDTFYFGQMQIRRMAELATRHRVAAIGPLREFAESIIRPLSKSECHA